MVDLSQIRKQYVGMQIINYQGNDRSWFTRVVHPETDELIALYKDGKLIQDYGKR
jgi:hypothetical protein